MKTIAFKPTKNMTFDTVMNDSKRLRAYCNKIQGRNLTIDLSAVVHCDSAGLAFLIEAKKMASEYAIACCFTGVTKNIFALAEFCAVTEILHNQCV